MARFSNKGKLCSVVGCVRDARVKGFCQTHYGYTRRGVAIEDLVGYIKPLRPPSKKRKRKTKCNIEGCTRPHQAKGYCARHYEAIKNDWVVSADPPSRKKREVCKVGGCERISNALGYCKAHYHRFKRGLELDAPLRPRNRTIGACSVPNCKGLGQSGGLCPAHCDRLKKHGDVRADIPIRKKAPKGSRWVNHQGYVTYILNGHPNAYGSGHILEHRFLMSEYLG